MVPKIFRSRHLAALAGGVLLAAAFPNIGIAGLAWIAPAIILFSAVGQSSRRSFGLGYVAGAGYFLTAFHWLLFIPVPLGAVAGWLALSAFLAFYFALWVWVCWRIFPAQERTESLAASLDSVSSLPWLQRSVWVFACAAMWVTMEMVLARFVTGFPWNLIGVSQYNNLPLIQMASVTGVYGVSFLVAWFSLAFGCAMIALIRRPWARRRMFAEIALPLAVVGFVMVYGWKRLEPPEQDRPTVRLALVQPSIPQTMIWDSSENVYRFNKLLELSRQALALKPDVLVWPEAALPPGLGAEHYGAVTRLIESHQVWTVLGADDVVVEEDEIEYFNAALLFDPDGGFVDSYRKRRLVIFGEYIPLARWFPFMKHLTPIEGSFTPGKEPATFTMTDPSAQFSVVICFEDVFPHYAREHVHEELDFLLTLTNNGWFGESAAHWQHAVNAVFRAVENGVPLVRSSNNGVTCWIDRFGRLRQVFRDEEDSIHGEGFMIAEVPLRAREERHGLTFYTRHGDWFGWTCVGFSMAFVAIRRFGRKERPMDPAANDAVRRDYKGDTDSAVAAPSSSSRRRPRE